MNLQKKIEDIEEVMGKLAQFAMIKDKELKREDRQLISNIVDLLYFLKDQLNIHRKEVP